MKTKIKAVILIIFWSASILSITLGTVFENKLPVYIGIIGVCLVVVVMFLWVCDGIKKYIDSIGNQND